MTKKTVGATLSLPEWNAGLKEPWHIDFDKEPVNDEKWSCVVTAAVQAEAQDEKCIQTYAQWVDTGLKKDVKIIHMKDVVKLIKEAGKQEKSEKREKNVKPPDSPLPQIVELAAKYAVISETECTLPPDLMAALLKYMILNLKRENCLAKRIAAVRERKIRKRNIKAKFIRSLKPYEEIQEERKSSEIGNANTTEQTTPTENEFIIGPDLYILLIDFYKVSVFPELLKINVPFLAILKISDNESLKLKNKPSISSTKSDGLERKKFTVTSFWETLKEMDDLDSQILKDIPVLEYNCKKTESTSTKYIYYELTWIQYSAYYIFRQYQNYLKELKVQRLVQSLETLDLSKCEVYNKLCDALITGEPLTPLLVLYAIVEQVVAGVPETDSMVLEYEPQFTDFFPTGSDSFMTANDSADFKSGVATSCMCAQKHYEKVCEELKRNLSNHSLSEKNKGIEPSEYNSGSPQSLHTENSLKKLNSPVRTEFVISKTLIDEVMKEKKTEKEMRNEKRWKTPSLCFYGDFVFLQTYYCDTRILDPKGVMKRFLKKLPLPQIWKNHSELLPEEKAYFNFHFHSFLKNSEECEEKLKIKIFFMCLSLQLISIKKSNWFIGEEEKSSEIIPDSFQEKKTVLNTLSHSDKRNNEDDEKEEQKFQDFFVKTFIRKTNSLHEKIHLIIKDENKTIMPSIKRAKSYLFINSQSLHKTKSELKIFTVGKKGRVHSTEKNSNMAESREQIHKFQNVPFSLIDCSEISNLIKHNFFLKKTDLNLIEEYKFYEKLTPRLMIQRLIEAEKNFNTVQYSHFPLIDTLLIIMYNDHDDRGVSFFNERGVLLTPVGFRDFYSYVYSQIKNWVNAENQHFLEFLSEVKERKKEEEERRDAKCLTKLKKKYGEMCEEKRKEFLETVIDVQGEPEVLECELGDLPVKPKPPNFSTFSFVVTNYSNLRVETNQKSYEFHSSDGTKVRTAVDTWLYSAKRLHKLSIKKSKLMLYYNQWLNEEPINLSFTLKTTSNIIFSFYKDDSQKMENFNYYLTVSWPTGLLIKPVFHDSNTYIRQSYLKIYRKGWDIEEERSRCFLKNGQVLIFRENGHYDVLCGSGTKYAFKDSETKYEVFSTTGEIWEVRNNNRCRNKKELIGCHKVFVGVDPKTQETFCRREDGVFVMLWQNGTLVTNYPDGTKITSTPYFEEREEIIEWTEEEKLHFENLYKSEISVQDPRSRTILRNASLPKYTEKKNSSNEGFISVECDYVMEHPKYSAVYFSKDPYIKLRMPEQLCVSIHQSGNYEIQQEKNFLKVNGDVVRFYTVCDDCSDQSTVTLNINSNETLCKCVDFSKKGFFVFRNGKIMFKKFHKKESEDEASDDKEEHEPEKTQSDRKLNNCGDGHNQKMASMQRCFILYRDLNGLEFIHADTFKDYCYSLPEETYFDINTDDPLNISYTFSSPNYKIGPEKWVMDYENAENSLPTSIKKKDLKELGAKETSAKLFKYPFPRHRVDCQQHEKSKRVINMPKLIIGRTIRHLSNEPSSVINQMQCYVEKYQKRAEDLYSKYEPRTKVDNSSQDSCNVEMRLRKIAFSLNQNFHMYPHLGIQFPSTEKEIHHFGHFINSMEGMKDRLQDDSNILPDCKQIPKPLPGLSDLPDISEEPETN